MSEKRSVSPIAITVMISSGIAIGGCFMPWQRLFGRQVAGVEHPDGRLFLWMAAGILVMSLLGILVKRFGRLASLLVLLVGGGLLTGSVMDLIMMQERFSKISSGGVLTSGSGIGEGLYAVVLGALLISIASLAGVISGDPNKEKTPTLHKGGPSE